jgi:hypothetical protein
VRFGRVWALNVLIALDTLGNCLLKGSPGETLSARAATARRDGRRWGCVLCRALDWLEADHCAQAMLGDSERAARVRVDFAPPPV